MLNRRRTRGFTLVEILAVVLLIGLLAVFVVPPFFKKTEKARAHIAKAQIMDLDAAVNAFFQDCGRYPEQAEGLSVLLNAPAGMEGKWDGPYCKESQLIDPWGSAMVYKRPGTRNRAFDIISYGSDGQSGGEGVAADVLNN